MKTIITTILVSSILLFACNNSEKESSKTETTSASHEEKHHHEEEHDAIVLNNGEKWKVDDSMMIYIQHIENDLNTFDAKTTAGYAALAKKIATNLDLLTSNCTMEGQAHDELHKWLLPFLDLSKTFSESKTEQEYATHFEELKTSFETFNKYFK